MSVVGLLIGLLPTDEGLHIELSAGYAVASSDWPAGFGTGVLSCIGWRFQ